MLERLGQRLRAYAEKDGRGYPDWAVRYMPVVKRVRHRDLEAECILEVGANESGFARFAKVRTIVTDVAVNHLRVARATQSVVPVVADVAALPFQAHSFDVCVCIDTLEHLPERSRGGALVEIARTLRESGTAVIAFPAGEAASRAEQAVREEYQALTGRPLKWLEEHHVAGLPDPQRIVSELETLASATHRITRKNNATLWIWRWMWRILACAWPGRGNAFFQGLLRFLTPVLCNLHFGACYRATVWVEPKGE